MRASSSALGILPSSEARQDTHGEAGHLVAIGPAEEEELADADVGVFSDRVGDLVEVAHQGDRGVLRYGTAPVQRVGVSQASRDSAIPRTEVNVTESDRAENSPWVFRWSETGVTKSSVAVIASSCVALVIREDEQPDFLARVEHRLDPPGEEGGALGAVSRQSACSTARAIAAARPPRSIRRGPARRPKGVFSRVLFDPVMLPLEGHRRLHGPECPADGQEFVGPLDARRRGSPRSSAGPRGYGPSRRQADPPADHRGEGVDLLDERRRSEDPPSEPRCRERRWTRSCTRSAVARTIGSGRWNP